MNYIDCPSDRHANVTLKNPSILLLTLGANSNGFWPLVMNVATFHPDNSARLSVFI